MSVYRAPRPVIELLASVLRSSDIPCAISSDSLGGMRPDLDFAHGSRLMVQSSDAADAEQILAEVEDGLPEV